MDKIILFLKSNRKWNSLLWIAIVFFLILVSFVINKKVKSGRVNSIKIIIENEEEVRFLDSSKIMEIAKGYQLENNILGNKIEKLAIDEIEKQLEFNPFIENADVSTDLKGELIIKIKQRIPVIRVYNNVGQTYYVSKNGFKFPVNSNYTPRVFVANGKIAETLMDSAYSKSKTLQDLVKVCNYCKADEFWNSQIEQLYVDNFMDINLIPKVGSHIIVFGSAEHFEEKFEKLKTFYINGLNNVGWEQYKKINIKYHNQIVAEKRN